MEIIGLESCSQTRRAIKLVQVTQGGLKGRTGGNGGASTRLHTLRSILKERGGGGLASSLTRKRIDWRRSRGKEKVGTVRGRGQGTVGESTHPQSTLSGRTLSRRNVGEVPQSPSCNWGINLRRKRKRHLLILTT